MQLLNYVDYPSWKAFIIWSHAMSFVNWRVRNFRNHLTKMARLYIERNRKIKQDIGLLTELICSLCSKMVYLVTLKSFGKKFGFCQLFKIKISEENQLTNSIVALVTASTVGHAQRRQRHSNYIVFGGALEIIRVLLGEKIIVVLFWASFLLVTNDA